MMELAPDDFSQRAANRLRAILPPFWAGLAIFCAKQLWAALFAIIILGSILVTRAIWQPEWPLARYDALFLIAITTQVILLVTRLETPQEAIVILLFHFTGTAMEWFKVSHGSWHYHEPGVFKVFNVPLFTGFMYASVGSYIARVTRAFDAIFAPYPPYWMSVILAVAIYANFMANRYLPDIRLVLFAASLILFLRTRMWFRIGERWLWAPFPLAALAIAFALWVAENIGTVTGTWAYPGQGRFQFVSLQKMGSWYLLFFVSFTTVTLVLRGALRQGPFTPESRSAASRKEPAPAAED